MRPSIQHNGKTFFIVDALEALASGVGSRFEISGKDIAVFRVGEKVYAFGNSCPHEGSSLCKGRLKPSEQIECAKHGWAFDVRTGERVLGGTETIPVYETLIQDGIVWVCVQH